MGTEETSKKAEETSKKAISANVQKCLDILKDNSEGLTAVQLATEMGFLEGLDPKEDPLDYKKALRKIRQIARNTVDNYGGSRVATVGRNKIYKVPA
ncbi:MAG: hypothetical protein ACTSVB_11430 [Candidatus Heimdallarchaeaceae archaeon]